MSKKILVVDDSATSRKIIKKVVEKLGHEVVAEAADGWEGLHKYQEIKPDLILSDIEMPKLDGYGMIEQLMKFDKNIKIAYITSVVNAQLIQKLFALGAFDVITKPVTDEKISELFKKI